MFEELIKLVKAEGEDAWTEFYEKMESGNCIDMDYLKHTSGKNIKEVEKDIATMTLDEVKTWLTWILRGERFCDGLFETCIDDGTLLALLQRGRDLS